MSLKKTLKMAKQIEQQLELLKKGVIHEKEDIDIVRKKRRRETKQQLRKTDWLSQ